MQYATVWQRGIDTFQTVTPGIFPHLHPTPDNSTTQSDLQTPRLILTPQQLIFPFGDPGSTGNFFHFCCVHVVAILCSKERERSLPPTFPPLIRTVCADTLKKCQPTCHAAVSALTSLLPSSLLFLGIYSFLASLAVRKEEVDHPSINFHSRVPLGNWLHFGGGCCKVQAGIISLHSC